MQIILLGMEMFEELLGTDSDAKDLTILQVSLRTAVIFVSAIIMVRIAHKRFLSKRTALDAVLAFIIASMLARAINGSAPLLPTLVGGFILVFLHRILAFLALRWSWFGNWVKGHDDILVENGRVIPEALERHNLSEADLLENLRLNAGVESPAQVKVARLERNGDVSVISK